MRTYLGLSELLQTTSHFTTSTLHQFTKVFHCNSWYILFILIMIWRNDLEAQDTTFCHTFSETLMTSEPEESAPCNDLPGPFFLRLYPHIIRRTDGSGGQSIQTVEDAISRMNEVFNGLNIFFVTQCTDPDFFIDDSIFFGKAIIKQCDLWEEFNHDDGIDLYFDDISAEIDGGISMGITGAAAIIGGVWILNPPSISVVETDIVSHEIGHALGLVHTHHGIEPAATIGCNSSFFPAGEPETPENCETKGDGCCDTPADPNLNNNVNLDCEWTEPDSMYNPDTRNIMSYSSPYCYEYLTACQGKQMRCAIYNSLANCIIPTDTILTINVTQTWTTSTVPYNGDFIISEALIVKSGKTLTVGAGVTLRFAENATLIIEPNATLNLYGTLTSADCNSHWKGIQVYGDADYNQYFDYLNGVYHQGLLQGFAGAKIENALIGVQLWGPTEEDTGGKIICTETNFLNNKIGVFFQPYKNIFLGHPRPYIGSFTECTFTVDNEFPLTTFDQHALLSGVDGISFSGCSFGHFRHPLYPVSQPSFGYGIAAVNAGFIVNASSSTPEFPGPCMEGDCDVITKSSFSGLGYGIWTGSFAENYLFRVYQTEFDNCYTGIEVDGVSGGVIILNNFEMAILQDPEVMNGDQVGIKLNQQLAGFTIEQNTFLASTGNASHTIGISAENLGEFSNVIRKNTFAGLTIANEAFGQNAGEGDKRFVGLRYTCNENINTDDKDFYIKNTTDYNPDNVSALQADFDEAELPIATGNQFSSTGNSSDSDFANYGVLIDEYYFDPNISVQIPDSTEGIIDELDADPNECVEEFCAPPCLSINDLSNLHEGYYDLRAEYDIAIGTSQWLKSAIKKVHMDEAAKLIVQHYLVDTVNFNRDSLRTWYANMLTLSADILLAKDYAANGDFTSAEYVLNGISGRYSINTQEQNDIINIQTIFDILSSHKVSEIEQEEIDTLIALSDNPGHCAAMARSILTLHGYRFETQYVLPGLSGQGQFAQQGSSSQTFEEVTIYPNPSSDGIINIVIPQAGKHPKMHIDIWSLTGVKILSSSLNGAYNIVKLPSEHMGGYAYRISEAGIVLKSGTVLVIN